MTALLTDSFNAMRGTEYTIGELAALYNVSLRALRFYESRNLLRPRRIGSARLYYARDRIRLELVLTGKRLGFSLTEISHLIDSRPIDMNADGAHLSKVLSKPELEKRIAVLEQRRDALRDAINDLRRAHDRIDAVGA